MEEQTNKKTKALYEHVQHSVVEEVGGMYFCDLPCTLDMQEDNKIACNFTGLLSTVHFTE